MASELNLHCMEAILKFLTPQDWIRVSEVCTWWKAAANEMWGKMNAIILTQKREYSQNYECLTSDEAQKMICLVAPFITSLSTNLNTKALLDVGSILFIHMKSPSKTLWFEVCAPDGASWLLYDCLNNMFKLLADNASELAHFELYNRYVPSAEALKDLFNDNNITKVSVEDAGLRAICENNVTDKIQELKCRFFDHGDVNYNIPFQGHFPNLQKLNIRVFDKKKSYVLRGPIHRPFLLQTLPYATGLKSLTVEMPTTLFSHQDVDFATDEIKNILKMSKLEELSLKFPHFSLLNVDSFFEKLAELLLEMRVVHFRDNSLSNGVVSSLMSLPKLESLSVEPKSDFNPTNIPQMVHLSKLFIPFNGVEIFGTVISNMLRQMPKLKLLAIKDYVVGDRILDIVCRATAVATSQNKKVLITTFYKNNSRFSRDPYAHITELQIEKKQNEKDSESETLNIRLTDRSSAWENLEDYLKTNLEADTLTFQIFKRDSLTTPK